MERVLLVTIKLKSETEGWRLEDMAEELEELAAACAVEIVDNITCILERPTPNFFIGRGKTAEIAIFCQEENIDTVIFSQDFSPTQQRNLEGIIGKKTIDRTQLILDIFARHARSPEGKTQVELAQLQYLMPRLVGKGVILSRLGGGIGTRGPGEQKLEVDRRRIRKKIDRLKKDLKQLKLHRSTIRKKRKENNIPNVALVGYTNAGKSTLLNALTGAGQAVAETLFTTLDPLSKALVLACGEHIVLSDTVGFLHQLPHHLIEAFKATLEEVTQADLLIHVLDVSSPRVYEHHQAVFAVLKELQADKRPLLTALNKIDLLAERNFLNRLQDDFPSAVAISAKFGENLLGLLQKIQEHFASQMSCLELLIPHRRMDLVNQLYRQGKVLAVEYLAKGISIKVNLPKIFSQKLLQNKEIEIVKEISEKTFL